MAIEANITRRTAMKSTLAAALVAGSGEFNLQHWLDTAHPAWVAQYHAARLAETMNALCPDRSFRYSLNGGEAVFVGDVKHAEGF